MRSSYHFKKEALNALSGNWAKAILTAFIASLIGSTIAASNSNYSSNNSTDFKYWELEEAVPLFAILIMILLIKAVISIIIGGAGKFGYAKFNLNLIDKEPCEFLDLFSQLNRIGAGFCMNFLIGLYTFLWSLLFIIPGIIKSYSYSMTPYIMSENPEMTASQAIAKSCEIMSGNKWRLFSLQISFIGWELLCFVPALIIILAFYFGTTSATILLLSLPLLFIGKLFLTPYKEAANAAFYRDISQTTVNHYSPRELPDSYRG